jgi:hypothetical protein
MSNSTLIEFGAWIWTGISDGRRSNYYTINQQMLASKVR